MPKNTWPANPKATIGPTSVGSTYGIVWSDFPPMERRGGYSGPYSTQAEAEQGARDWVEAYGYRVADLIIEHKPIE